MARILVTGGRGVLGRELVSRLQTGPHLIRVMSRSPRPPSSGPDIEWAKADLAAGSGLSEAVGGVDVILHAATGSVQKAAQTDVEGTRRLLDVAARAGVAHIIYISIVGIDRVPGFSYYRHKLETEALIQQGTIPWTILRATQFHNFIDMVLTMSARLPVMLVPTAFRSQPVDVGEVADRMVPLVDGPASGVLPDVAGPEVLRLGDMAREWKRVRGIHKPMLNLPLAGRTAAGFKDGSITAPDHAVGTVTWREWLQRTYASNAQPRASFSGAHTPRVEPQ